MSDEFDDFLNDVEHPAFKSNVFGIFPSAFVGGSYVVDPENANDIDIYVIEAEFDKAYMIEHGYEKQVNSNGCHADIEYDTEWAVKSHWRKNEFNVIFVSNLYYGAYIAAVNEMQRNPGLYMTRAERIRLHREKRNVVRLLIDPNAQLEDVD